MRRAQVDEWSQPVRNLVYGPAFRLTNGFNNIRTNLCNYPNFELASSTQYVRTNLCTNPRGVFTLSDYSGAGNQTITPNVAITGHPDGITTANRVTYTTGANPGVTFFFPAANTTYTISAWVYHESVMSGPGSASFAQAGVASQPGAPATAVSTQWQRLSWTYTTGASTNQIGYRVSAQSGTGTGSFLITGVLVETTTALDTFFDGATAATFNLASQNATAGNATLTTGVSYAGQTWTRAATATGSGSVNARQIVNNGSLGSGGKTYTVGVTVANDQAFSQIVALDWCDTGSQTFNIAPGEIRRLVISSSRSVYDATYRFADLQINQSLTESRSMLFKDWVIEEGTTEGAYYTTTGDFTYAWSGTANASTSNQIAPNATGWLNASFGKPYSSVISPYMGTRCAAVRTLGNNGDGGYWPDSNVTAGTTYTVSMWVRLTTSVPTMSLVMRWKDSAFNILSDSGGDIAPNLVVGQWTRVSWTAVAPTGATKLQPMLRIYSGSHTATTFYVDACLIEVGNLDTYFDGSSATVGDMTHAWSGTAHATPSYQRMPAGDGLVAYRSNTGAFNSGKWYGVIATAEDGKKVARWVAPANSGSTSWRIAGVIASGWDYTKVKAGGRYTLMVRFRTSGWPTGKLPIQIAYGSSTNHVIANEAAGLQPDLNQPGWQTYRRTFTALRDADAAQVLYITCPVTPSTTTDGVLDVREWMLVEGEYTGDFIDGTQPFSKWDGTANASTSVGYPQQLLDLAGKPLMDYTTAGTYTLDDSFGTTEGRTFYTVYDVLQDIPATIDAVASYGETNLNDTVANNYITLRLEQGNAAMSNIKSRRTGGGGPISLNAIPVATCVTAWGLNSDGTQFIQTNNGTEANDVQVMAVPHQKIIISADNTYHKHYRTIMYRGKHDAATRQAIQRYLGNKYGANVA